MTRCAILVRNLWLPALLPSYIQQRSPSSVTQYLQNSSMNITESTPLDYIFITQKKKSSLAYTHNLLKTILPLGVKAVHLTSMTSFSHIFLSGAHHYCRNIKECVKLCSLKITVPHAVTQNLIALWKMLFDCNHSSHEKQIIHDIRKNYEELI
jgi:hypothetical protein